jgi:hypothetical protein
MNERFYSLSCGVEYIEVPKCACTSIKLALAAADGIGEESIPRPHTSERWRACPGFFVPCITFTFVRNPLERLKSAWREKLQTGKARKLGGQCPLPLDAPFSDFVAWVADQPTASLDKHWKPQSLLLANRRPSFIGRFEQLQEGWGHLVAGYGLPILPHVNQSGDVPVPCDGPTRRLVARLYSRDFEEFGYEI